MHEFSLMQSVLDTVETSARKAGAVRVTAIRLTIGEMAEVVFDAMEFAFEALSPETLSEGAELSMRSVIPRSRCCVCGEEFTHDRYHWACPSCDSLATELIAGRELFIDSIEIEESVSIGDSGLTSDSGSAGEPDSTNEPPVGQGADTQEEPDVIDDGRGAL